MNFIEVLDAVSAGGSDNQASQKLGITRAMYSHYRTGRKTPSDEILDKMAKISKITPAKVYLAAYAEKIHNPTVAEEFRQLASNQITRINYTFS